MIASRVSRLAWSSPVSIVPLCHNSAPAASAFQPGGGLRQIRRTKSEQLLLGLGLDKGRKICWAARALISGSLDLESLVREPSHRLVTDRLRALHGVGDKVATAWRCSPWNIWTHSPWTFTFHVHSPVITGTSPEALRRWGQHRFGRYAGYAEAVLFMDDFTGTNGQGRSGEAGPLNRLGNCKYGTVSRPAGAGPSPPASRPEPPSPTSTPPPACGRATTQPVTRWWQRPSGLAQPGPGTQAGRCPHRRCPGAGPGGPAPAPAGPAGDGWNRRKPPSAAPPWTWTSSGSWPTPGRRRGAGHPAPGAPNSPPGGTSPAGALRTGAPDFRQFRPL